MSGTIGHRLRKALLVGVVAVALTGAPAVPAAAEEPLPEPTPVIEVPDPEIETPAPSEPPPSEEDPAPVPSPTEEPQPPQTVPSVPAAVPALPAVPEQALIDPVTGFRIERSSGYLIHPQSGYLIEPGTGNLVDGRTWLYTDLRWDPATGLVSSIYDEPEESPAPSASSATPESPTPTASPAPKSAPQKTEPDEQLSATPAKVDSGTDWSTHWVTRAGVILLLAVGAAFYYVKLRRTGSTSVSVRK